MCTKWWIPRFRAETNEIKWGRCGDLSTHTLQGNWDDFRPSAPLLTIMIILTVLQITSSDFPVYCEVFYD